MHVSEVMHDGVEVIAPGATFAAAASTLRDRRISSLVVSEGGRPEGIVTERDIVSVIADGLDPGATSIGERMAGEPLTVDRGADIREAARLMAERGIRHLPVVDGGELVGMISMRDLVTWASRESGASPDMWPDLMEAIATEWPH